MTSWQPAYVGIGSNLGDRVAAVRAAAAQLGAIESTRLVVLSPLYRTPPFGPVEQPEFINAVAGLLTQLDPHDLLAAMRTLETRMGREPARVRWGPRVIDLDLLVLGAARVADTGLVLPHPGIAERAFVLRPLADIASSLEIPGVGRVSDLLAALDDPGIVPLEGEGSAT